MEEDHRTVKQFQASIAFVVRVTITVAACGWFAVIGEAQSGGVAPDSDTARIAALESQLRAMEQRLLLLERKLEEKSDAALIASNGMIPAAAVERVMANAVPVAASAAPQSPVQSSPPSPIVGAGGDGFNIRSTNSDFRLNIRYQMQVDSRFAVDRTTGEPNSIFLRRAQPILAGSVFRRFDYIILLDFAEGRPRVNDSYMDIAFLPALRLRAGKFKMPVGLERLRSGFALTIPERSLATQLIPNRDVGLQLWGDVAGGKLSYAAAVFNGVADAATQDGDTDDGKEFAGRVFSHPFAGSGIGPLAGMGLGLGVSRGKTSNLPNYSTTGDTTFFAYSTAARADGTRYRIDPQAYYFYGRLGLLGEYVVSSQQIRNNMTGITYSPKNTGFQVQGTFFLTSDKAAYAAAIPERNYEPSGGSFGAFELAARYTELRVDHGVFEQGIGGGFAQKAKAWALGLNWYMNRSVRLMFNYEQTDFVERPGIADVSKEKVFLQRMQLKF